ncbi:hypothetical protein EJD97_012229 [Solanum chilense]|uniref:Uncharacterized protein n=1 Tax=Solanum chilense TaxID=4083 RepID=A0A6N2BDQ1_SOLCI|nr:hypothetical protein EJD97_012229 [Solanum chilense]
MALHARHQPIVCAVPGPCRHSTSYVVQSCVLSKVMEFKNRRRLTVLCAAKRHTTPEVIRPCVMSKGHDNIPRPMYLDHCVLYKGDDVMPGPTSSDRMCWPRARRDMKARLHLTVCAAQVPCRHATPNIVLSCVLSKGDDNMPSPTSLDYVCFPRLMMACHTRLCPTVCAFQER